MHSQTFALVRPLARTNSTLIHMLMFVVSVCLVACAKKNEQPVLSIRADDTFGVCRVGNTVLSLGDVSSLVHRCQTQFLIRVSGRPVEQLIYSSDFGAVIPTDRVRRVSIEIEMMEATGRSLWKAEAGWRAKDLDEMRRE
jgi:hypothetical protein